MFSEYVWALSDAKSFSQNFIREGGAVYILKNNFTVENALVMPFKNNSYVNNYGYSGMPILEHFEDAEFVPSMELEKGLVIVSNGDFVYSKSAKYWVRFEKIINRDIFLEAGLKHENI